MFIDECDALRGVVPSDEDAAPEVSVLIVGHNSRSFIEECFGGLATALEGVRYKVIVANNASTDGTDLLLSDRRDIRFIRSTRNLGFAGGKWLASSIARGSRLLARRLRPAEKGGT
jgi:GT2 family glycosyltransferase